MAHYSHAFPAGDEMKTILLIDDDPISREVMQMTLEMHGASVETAECGDDAIRLLAEWDSAQKDALRLILMDTQMPGLSGAALVQQLRQSTAARIFAISASEPGEVVRGAVDGFLIKPVQAEEVMTILKGAKDAAPETIAPERLETVHAVAGESDLIDLVVLGKLKAMMPESAIREIYSATAADLKGRLVRLSDAMTAEDKPEVARIAHSIKGGCAMVGLSGARDAAARLESSNLQVSWSSELSQLRIALKGLEGMLVNGFPS